MRGADAYISLESNYHTNEGCCSSLEIDWFQLGYPAAHALIGEISISRTTKGYIKPRSTLIERETT